MKNFKSLDIMEITSIILLKEKKKLLLFLKKKKVDAKSCFKAREKEKWRRKRESKTRYGEVILEKRKGILVKLGQRNWISKSSSSYRREGLGLGILLLSTSLAVAPYRFFFFLFQKPVFQIPSLKGRGTLIFGLQNVGEGSQGSDNGQICLQQQG